MGVANGSCMITNFAFSKQLEQAYHGWTSTPPCWQQLSWVSRARRHAGHAVCVCQQITHERNVLWLLWSIRETPLHCNLIVHLTLITRCDVPTHTALTMHATGSTVVAATV